MAKVEGVLACQQAKSPLRKRQLGARGHQAQKENATDCADRVQANPLRMNLHEILGILNNPSNRFE